MLENNLGLTSSAELHDAEERLTKQRAAQLFADRLLDGKPAGTFQTLAFIHAHLFQDVYPFAGKVREVDISKGGFRFASALYLDGALKSIEGMPQADFDQIIKKYVEMNVAHPFREGNGRSMRLWLDHILKEELGQVVIGAGWTSRTTFLPWSAAPSKTLRSGCSSKALSPLRWMTATSS